ncbi:MAG: glutamate formimidoyltransferase, partial [Anaerolineae bacterium]|nr:glutamate formimidoyltransferase [Anaerolineae bacterium]
MKPLVECVPNFSEGRRPDVIAQIVEAMTHAGGIYILDTTADPDHNRCVVTLAGLPEEVEKAVFAGIRTASQLINLDEHEGVHPRFGAADVVPFVPLRDVTMQECVALAHQLGRRVAYELQIPVYFYESAALRVHYQDLADIRRPSFQYEQLREVIGLDPAWMPDVGPAQMGSAGAVLIGARPLLVAYNVYLNTDNVTTAKKIARAIRHSGGGLRHVKSAGFLVNGKAQVSMNLTDFEQTPLYRVMELLRLEAARYGTAAESAELIGLIPEAALLDSAQWYLQLEDFDSSRILERRLSQA